MSDATLTPAASMPSMARLGRYIRFSHDDLRALMAQTAVPVTVPDDELSSASQRGRPARS